MDLKFEGKVAGWIKSPSENGTQHYTFKVWGFQIGAALTHNQAFRMACQFSGKALEV